LVLGQQFLHICTCVAASLTPFLKLFQRDEPLVHILYHKVNEVTCICLRMFLKAEVVADKCPESRWLWEIWKLFTQ